MRQLSTQERKEAMSINGWAPKPSAVERNVVAVALALVVALSALLLPSPASAQAKIRIAIWDFENNAERHWWFWNDLGPAARNFIDTAFADDPSLSAKFSVIEREKLERGVAVGVFGFPARSTDTGDPRARFVEGVLGDVRGGRYFEIGQGITPGMSGSPIFTRDDRVVGVVVGGELAEAESRGEGNWGLSVAALREMLEER